MEKNNNEPFFKRIIKLINYTEEIRIIDVEKADMLETLLDNEDERIKFLDIFDKFIYPELVNRTDNFVEVLQLDFDKKLEAVKQTDIELDEILVSQLKSIFNRLSLRVKKKLDVKRAIEKQFKFIKLAYVH